MSFYLFLPSNVNPSYFPDNRISSFQVKLPKRLSFEPNKYHVAITELSYVHSMKTFIQEADRYIILHQPDPNEQDKVIGQSRYLPNINYSHITTLLLELNNALVGYKGEVIGIFKYDAKTNRVKLSINTGKAILSEKITKSLGFEKENIPYTKQVGFSAGEHQANRAPELSGGIYHIFVYSDIVLPQMVGNSLVPLLRIVSISGEEGKAVTETFRPYYLPISKLEFDTVQIVLCNEFGEEIEFEKGQAIVTLHFKKV